MSLASTAPRPMHSSFSYIEGIDDGVDDYDRVSRPVSGLVSVDFEVSGDVQDAYFRKGAEAYGKKLDLCGYCFTSPNGNLMGSIQGPKKNVDKMKRWLSEIGSPKSRIACCNFFFEHPIDDYEMDPFSIRHIPRVETVEAAVDEELLSRISSRMSRLEDDGVTTRPPSYRSSPPTNRSSPPTARSALQTSRTAISSRSSHTATTIAQNEPLIEGQVDTVILTGDPEQVIEAVEELEKAGLVEGPVVVEAE